MKLKYLSFAVIWSILVDVQQDFPYQGEIKRDKIARIRAKPWKFRLPFNVYGAVIT